MKMWVISHCQEDGWMERFNQGKIKYLGKLQKMTIFLVLLLKKIPECLIFYYSGNMERFNDGKKR